MLIFTKCVSLIHTAERRGLSSPVDWRKQVSGWPVPVITVILFSFNLGLQWLAIFNIFPKILMANLNTELLYFLVAAVLHFCTDFLKESTGHFGLNLEAGSSETT